MQLKVAPNLDFNISHPVHCILNNHLTTPFFLARSSRFHIFLPFFTKKVQIIKNIPAFTSCIKIVRRLPHL
jgi:hypothetical protein